jgi:23S rRNA pseudouridine2604 synthase
MLTTLLRPRTVLIFLSLIFASSVCRVACLLQARFWRTRLSSGPFSGNGQQHYLGRRLRLEAVSKDTGGEGIDAKKDEGSSSASNITPIRLNKVFKATHSRREADRIIQEGRAMVNGAVSFGDMVMPYQDEITLDGNLVQGWEKMNSLVEPQQQREEETKTSNFEYVKYYKPRGIICTTDQRIDGNVIDALTRESGYRPKHRVYPVGRLDKDSSGLILITSDGRLPNASLRRQQKQPKYYRVRVDRAISDEDLEALRSGITITTVAQRDGKSKPLTAKTKPCIVTLLAPKSVEIVLEEGRNRQIRKMMAALGYEVVILHRVRFGNISLDNDMSAGDWKALNRDELQWITSILEPKEEEA